MASHSVALASGGAHASSPSAPLPPHSALAFLAAAAAMVACMLATPPLKPPRSTAATGWLRPGGARTSACSLALAARSCSRVLTAAMGPVSPGMTLGPVAAGGAAG